MKQSILILIGVFLITFSQAQYDPKALEVLEAMSKKYRAYASFEANFTRTLTNESAGIKEQLKLKATVKGDKYILELAEQMIYNNGTTQWTYLPASKEVNIDNVDAKSDEFNLTKIFQMYKKGFKYLFLGEANENGIPCDEIDLVPEKKDSQYFKIKMMIARKDKSVVTFTMFDRSGNRYKNTITKFTPNVKLDDSVFTFDPKKFPGVEVIDLR